MNEDEKERAMAEPNMKQVLMMQRIIWGAMLLGLVVFAVICGVLIQNAEGAEAAGEAIPDGSALLMVSLGMTAMLIPAGIFIRGQIFKKNWQGEVVAPKGYATGNIVAWAMCEGPAYFSLIVCLMMKSWWPYGIGFAVSAGLLTSLWPNGKAMLPMDAWGERKAEE